jgi:hypothetical protein
MGNNPVTSERLVMDIRTKIFELGRGKYRTLPVLARSMGLSANQVYRVWKGELGIDQEFIIGAIKAFPECHLGDLFYITADDKR